MGNGNRYITRHEVVFAQLYEFMCLLFIIFKYAQCPKCVAHLFLLLVKFYCFASGGGG